MVKLALASLLLVLLSACSSKDPIYLGSLTSYSPLPLGALPKKPKSEITRICSSASVFSKQDLRESLSLDKLLEKAKNEGNSGVLEKVGIWQWRVSALGLWKKHCLILGRVD